MDITASENIKGKRSIRSKESSIKSIGSRKSVLKKRSIDTTNGHESEISLTEEEEKTLIVNSVWQDIVTTAFDQIYENDLDKETVYFVSRCSRLAWRALVELNYQRRDPGGYREADTEDLDVEPATSAKDSWAGTSVQVVGGATEEAPAPLASAAKSDPGTTEVTLSTFTGTDKTTDPSETILTRTASKKTTDVGRELLQIMRKRQRARSDPETLAGGRLGTTILKSGFELKKDSYELPSPVAMQSKYFPPPRVEVDYAVSAGTRGVASRKPPKTKTINLKCILPGEAEEAERAARRSRVSQRRATLSGGGTL